MLGIADVKEHDQRAVWCPLIVVAEVAERFVAGRYAGEASAPRARLARRFQRDSKHVADHLHSPRVLVHLWRNTALPVEWHESAVDDRVVDRRLVIQIGLGRVEVVAFFEAVAPHALAVLVA